MKYKRRPEFIEAIQFDGTSDQVIEWLHTLDGVNVEEALQFFDFNPEIGICEVRGMAGMTIIWSERKDEISGEALKADYICYRRHGDIFAGVPAILFENEYEVDVETGEPTDATEGKTHIFGKKR